MCAALGVNPQKRILADKLREKLGINCDDQLTSLIECEWDQAVLERLIPIVSIGETYFFRDPKFWHYCKQETFPAFIKALHDGRKEINIWSAASSTGEEAYTISMLIRQFLSTELKQACSIFASDINHTFLEHAKKGKYSKWSLRATPADAQERFFTASSDGGFQLQPEIIESVQFFSHNLIAEVTPSIANFPKSFDLIICRNVLMYFEDWQILRIVERLASQLVEGGLLILSPQDIWHAKKCSDLQIVSLPDLILLRKRSSEDYAGEPIIHDEVPSTELRASVFDFQQILSSSMIVSSENTAPVALYDVSESQKMSAVIRSDPPDEKSTENSLRNSIHNKANAREFDEALEFCEKAIKGEPLDALLYYIKSDILHQKGDTQLALKALQQAVFLEPDFVVAHLALYNTLKKLERTEQSNVSFRNVSKLLEKLPSDQLVPHSDGMTSGQILQILKLNRVDED